MPDSKITALASIGTGTDPVNDALVIVDVSDVSPGGMSATGTTKRVSLNNLLASSPTATLASATITGDLTVDTNVLKVDTTLNRVGVLNASPGVAFHIGTTGGTNRFAINTAFTSGGDIQLRRGAFIGFSNAADSGNSEYLFANGGALDFGINGSTAMTLNATGLGVGGVPSNVLTVRAAQDTGLELNSAASNSSRLITAYDPANSRWYINSTFNGSGTTLPIAFLIGNTERMRIDTSGNVGIGVTPSAWGAGIKGLELGSLGSGITSGGTYSGTLYATMNAYNDGSWKFARNAAAGLYGLNSDKSFAWFQSSNAPSVGGAITWTQAMTLDASGNLLVGSALPVSGGRISGNSSTGPAGRFFSSAGDNQFAAMFDKSSATNTTSQFLIGFTINNQATGSGQINANGASQAAFGTFSDSRLKENIVSLPSQLANILSLRPVEFDYKDGSGHQIGFVAQEMQGVYSDTVSEQNGFLTVTGWSKTEARLVSAIKELAAKVQALEAKLA